LDAKPAREGSVMRGLGALGTKANSFIREEKVNTNIK